jgi:hypothetical protein
MLETATKFILDFVLKNEEVQKFPQDFVTASMQWVRSWFLTDEDPNTKAILTSDAPVEAKKAAIEQKTKALQENPQFRQELTERLREYGIHVANSRNVAIGNTIQAHTVHFGDVVYQSPSPATAHVNSTSTVSQGHFSEIERQGQEDRLRLLVQKRQAVQRGYDLEDNAARQFASEKQLADLDTQIAALKSQLGL